MRRTGFRPLKAIAVIVLAGCSSQSRVATVESVPSQVVEVSSPSAKARAVGEDQFLEILFKIMPPSTEISQALKDELWRQALDVCQAFDEEQTVAEVMSNIDTQAQEDVTLLKVMQTVASVAVTDVCPEHSKQLVELQRLENSQLRAIDKPQFLKELENKFPWLTGNLDTVQDGVVLGDNLWDIALNVCDLLDRGHTVQDLLSQVGSDYQDQPVLYDLHMGIVLISMTEVCPGYKLLVQEFLNQLAAHARSQS